MLYTRPVRCGAGRGGYKAGRLNWECGVCNMVCGIPCLLVRGPWFALNVRGPWNCHFEHPGRPAGVKTFIMWTPTQLINILEMHSYVEDRVHLCLLSTQHIFIWSTPLNPLRKNYFKFQYFSPLEGHPNFSFHILRFFVPTCFYSLSNMGHKLTSLIKLLKRLAWSDRVKQWS